MRATTVAGLVVDAAGPAVLWAGGAFGAMIARVLATRAGHRRPRVAG